MGKVQNSVCVQSLEPPLKTREEYSHKLFPRLTLKQYKFFGGFGGRERGIKRPQVNLGFGNDLVLPNHTKHRLGPDKLQTVCTEQSAVVFCLVWFLIRHVA